MRVFVWFTQSYSGIRMHHLEYVCQREKMQFNKWITRLEKTSFWIELCLSHFRILGAGCVDKWIPKKKHIKTSQFIIFSHWGGYRSWHGKRNWIGVLFRPFTISYLQSQADFLCIILCTTQTYILFNLEEKEQLEFIWKLPNQFTNLINVMQSLSLILNNSNPRNSW